MNMKTNVHLTEMEAKVYNALVENAKEYGEAGGCCHDEINLKKLGINNRQLKGYLSSLVKKGMLLTIEDGYFTFTVVELRDC